MPCFLIASTKSSSISLDRCTDRTGRQVDYFVLLLLVLDSGAENDEITVPLLSISSTCVVAISLSLLQLPLAQSIAANTDLSITIHWLVGLQSYDASFETSTK